MTGHRLFNKASGSFGLRPLPHSRLKACLARPEWESRLTAPGYGKSATEWPEWVGFAGAERRVVGLCYNSQVAYRTADSGRHR